jgi:hypothetical protein
MIFSNKFPYLKSSYLTTVYSPSFQVRQLSWNQSPSIRSLRITSRDSLIHLAILNACPNLSSLHLTLYQLDPTPIDIKPHRNLKQLTFIFNGLIDEAFYSLIPCLERLIIEQSIHFSEEDLHFDYLGKQLLSLKQLKYILHLLNSNQYEIICQIQTNFLNNFSNKKSHHLYIK